MGIGFTNFLGELGGTNNVGKHLLQDYEFAATRPAMNIGIRYKNSQYYALKGMLSMGMLYGNDDLTREQYRNNRNLSFRSPVIELTGQIEGYVTKEKPRRLYKISGIKTTKKRNYSAYGFLGVGITYFNPQGKYEGRWTNLRPLGTEGQGMTGGPKKYLPVTIVIPVGIGLKTAIDKKWSAGVEVGFRKTFTDYMDDVSGKYYDNDAIRVAKGDKAADLADPSKGNVKGASEPNADGSGAQRGNPKHKDAYMFFTINACYKFTKKKRTRSKF